MRHEGSRLDEHAVMAETAQDAYTTQLPGKLSIHSDIHSDNWRKLNPTVGATTASHGSLISMTMASELRMMRQQYLQADI